MTDFWYSTLSLDGLPSLTHWGRVTHICISNLTIIGSDNGLSPGRCQAIIWTNVGKLLIRPLGTNFSEILIRVPTFSFRKMELNMSSVKWRPLSRPQWVISSDAGDEIFWLWESIPCLLMPWLLKSPEHQHAWHWLCRTDNMYFCYRVNFIYLGHAKSKTWFKIWIYLLQSLKQFSMLRVKCWGIFKYNNPQIQALY